ncbi:type I methionyl aminopeptidase [Belliella kenyensis]|uniref:Methionine aminopeptidase n=1 Tax=Belliella kenyensis TaxID=1472724 RepID=A0ABV8ENW6_9BACT|nr:type I methionyl aminopeptidase [Belliella kenyensis]MCH7402924.1 type I methionyl aminopeptidase [Belliella kenyensis]MDN3602630.1 type I methionyl aminopeptidase [Belliella kenyensis]
MSINTDSDLIAMQKVSDVVAYTLKEMKQYAKPGMSTKELDDFGGNILRDFGAKSAPRQTYNFPGWTCISINNEFCHGLPSSNKILGEGELINIDVSAELEGYWSDNGASFVLGVDKFKHQPLIDASKDILKQALDRIKGGVRISDIGHLMETEAKKYGYKVIRNLGGHGIGRSLHEQPDELLNYRNKYDQRRFRKNTVVAIETFIATQSTLAVTTNDGWTMVGNRGGHMAQHEHTIVITDSKPIILTEKNEIWQ